MSACATIMGTCSDEQNITGMSYLRPLLVRLLSTDIMNGGTRQQKGSSSKLRSCTFASFGDAFGFCFCYLSFLGGACEKDPVTFRLGRSVQL